MKIYLDPNLIGYYTELDLLRAEGTLLLTLIWKPYKSTIASITSENPKFNFELKIDDGVLVFKRNDNIVIHHARKHKGQIVTIGFAWTTNLIKTIFSLNKEPILRSNKPLDSQENSIVKTPFTLPPNNLIVYAREAEKIPDKNYSSVKDFRQNVLKSIQLAQTEINQTGSYSNFWNTIKESGRIIKREPKDETDIHNSIHSLIFDFCLKNGISIEREKYTSIGNIDFVFNTMIDNKKVEIPCEVKKAYSNDLIHGYETQLPTYMNQLGVDFGIYLIIYFAGEWFEGDSIEEILTHLDEKADHNVTNNIRVVLLDVTKPISASKRNK